MPFTRRALKRAREAEKAADEAAGGGGAPSTATGASSDSPPEEMEPDSRPDKKDPHQRRDLRGIIPVLNCEWLGCDYTTKSMEKFIKHVDKHVPISPDPGNTYERCRWADCTFRVLDERMIRRHVLYHAYHCRLMAFGAEILKRSGIRRCTLDSSERHLLPDLPDPFVCYWQDCTAEFDDPQTFFWHVTYHVKCHYQGEKLDGSRPAKCLWLDCTASHRSHYRLRDHMRVHTREKPMACPTCGIVFANTAKFEDHHLRQTSFEDLRYQCSHCLKLFATVRILRDHIRYHINKYRCQLCTMTVPSMNALRVHMLYKHTDERNFSCPKCSQTCKTSNDLEVHLRAHNMWERNERLPCPHEGCRFAFLTEERLKRHYNKIHSGQPRSYYFCHLCDTRYLAAVNLGVHFKRAHNLRVPDGHTRFKYRRGADGHYRLETLRYESLEVAELAEAAAAPEPQPVPQPAAATPMMDVLALSCEDGDVPDTINADDGRELHLPEEVRRALATGRRVLVCVQGDQVQLLANVDAMNELGDPDDPDALMMVVDGQAVAVGPAPDAQ
ncbi:histone H4 transcription factor-like [Amphibalanus amphitrite]|uniref:histone H4 transcription factor-like n=1 Tax=Amphibalanus amphitrite TaxID=1232801 RepID=UPI001C907CD6|nr:histone H4 transcription factor-like [Amphibalanus amphitrite]XP_043245626.1 histone H4 transcription factor-like [Amphibalanus amphitrite]XP_043245627.1 histone H4 transcription factor-like [Amphibalanus amphitrite]